MKKKFILLFYFLISILLSCASKQKQQVDENYHSSIFLNTEKNYNLTSGFANNSLDAKIDQSGEYVYYSKELGGNTDIFAINTYTLKNYRLSRSPAIDSYVSIDDRAQYLVFSSTRDDAFGDVFLYKLTKYRIRKSYDDLDELENSAIRLTKHRGYDIMPSISKDGSLIAFVSDREGTNQLYTMRSYDGANVVKRSSLRARNPKFSFNGKMIVFETAEIGESSSQIAVVDLATGITATITDTKTMKFNPTFYNDDIIIYFEIEKDTDNDGELTYSDKRKLVSYSISEKEIYVLDENTTLTSFDVGVPSSSFAVFISQINSRGTVALSSTKKYFIKDYDVNRMYNTFSDMDYNKKLNHIETFARYFPNTNSDAVLSLAYFDLMYESYTNTNANSNLLFDSFRNTITNKYADTLISSNIVNIYNVLDGNIEYTNIFTDVRFNFILANELLKTSDIEKNYLAFLILEESLYSKNIKDKEVYKSLVSLYNKSLYKNNVQYINTHLYNAPYDRNDILTFSEKLELAKNSVREYGFVYDGIIEEFKPEDILSIATRLIYLDNLIIAGNDEYTKSLFTNYTALQNNTLKAIGNYAIARIYLSDNNDLAYQTFREALRLGGRDFANTEEASYSRDILNKYYKTIADNAYNKNQFSLAYDSYKNVLEYNPNDSTAAYRIVESSLKSLSDIEELERVIKKREKAIVRDRYTDDTSHSELALTYYYLASRYYQKAIALEKSPNRYIMRDRKREDGFYYYLNKSFNSIIENACFYIDFACFLNPNNGSYYIKKAEMLSFASALRVRIMQDDKTYRSLVELLPSYSEDNVKQNKIDGYYNIAFKSSDIEARIISSLEEARAILGKSGDDANISIMLANAYLINGRYEDAKTEYEKYSKIADKQLSKKSSAWYHFFYGYSLWIGNDIKKSLEEYNKASILFNSLNDIESLYKVIGYSAVASIEQKDYKSAIAYLQEKEKMIEKYKYQDDLNNLLLALCYLQVKDYNKAIEYCDKSKQYIDNLDYKDFNPRYIKLSFLGSSINVVNLGLASFGGYIPGEPLNVDKKQMLYSLYQELYESLGMFPQSREALTLYKNYILEDTPKKDIKPLMLATYYNNEGYLYYKQGDKNNALESFKKSVSEFKNSISPIELKDNPYAIYKNAQNDIKNYLSISSIYLDFLNSNDLSGVDVNTIIKELKDIDYNLNILSTNIYITAKEKIIINSHLAARNYIYATKLPRQVNTTNFMDEHNYNTRRLALIKEATDKYKYILDQRNNLPLDLKTEIIVRYNLALCYEAGGYTELASKEYVSAYMKASSSSFVIEEIGILVKLMDFSKNYRYLYIENIETEEKYARKILKLLEDSVFMIVLSPDNQILRNAREVLLQYFNTADPKSSVDVITLFSSIELRRAFLSERLTPFTGRTAFHLRDYYTQYENTLLKFQGYQESVLRDYDKKKESDYLKEIKNIEINTKKSFSNTAIAPIVLGLFNSKYLQNILRTNETLIIDTSYNLRFAIEKNKIYPLNITNSITNAKNYITYVGTNNIVVENNSSNSFVRYIRNISEYIVPRPTVLVEKNEYTSLKEIKKVALQNTLPSNTNTNSNTNFIDINTTNTNSTVKTNSTKGTVRVVQSASKNNNTALKYSTIESITNNPYMPIIVDLSDMNTDTLEKIKSKNYYGIYVNKQTYDNNIRLINSLNTIFLIVGTSNNISKNHFANSYMDNINKNSIENVMAGYDNNLYKVYGKTDTTIAELDSSIVLFKTTMSNIYKARNITNANDPFISTIIKYSKDDNEKLKNYIMFIEDYTLKNNTNITYPLSYLGFELIKNDSKNIIEETNAYNFMKTMLNAYRRNRTESDVISNANRILLYANKYTNLSNNLINEHFTENNLSLFLRLSKNTKDGANTLDTIVSYIDNTNKNRIYTLAYFYHSLYAKSPSDKTDYYLNKIYSNRIITNYTITNVVNVVEGFYAYEETITNINIITNTTLPEQIVNNINTKNITNENELIGTMDYIYNNQLFFTRQTVASFENIFYSSFSSKAEYVFGFLAKKRFNNKDDYKTLVSNMSNVVNNYNTNTMFINIILDDNNNFNAYTYNVGASNTRKIVLNNNTKFRELNNIFLNSKTEKDRFIALSNIERELSSKILRDDILLADKIFITSQSTDIMKIPFSFMQVFSNKTVVKVKNLKIEDGNVESINTPIKLITENTNNFYNNLQTQLVSSVSIREPNSKNNFIYYADNCTTNTTRDVKVESFITGITDREFATYMFDNNTKNKIVYSLKLEDSGDYYKTMRLLFNGFENGVIKSFENMRAIYSNYKIMPYIKESDTSIYGTLSYTLFDYILPSLPKAE